MLTQWQIKHVTVTKIKTSITTKTITTTITVIIERSAKNKRARNVGTNTNITFQIRRRHAGRPQMAGQLQRLGSGDHLENAKVAPKTTKKYRGYCVVMKPQIDKFSY